MELHELNTYKQSSSPPIDIPSKKLSNLIDSNYKDNTDDTEYIEKKNRNDTFLNFLHNTTQLKKSNGSSGSIDNDIFIFEL